MPKDARGNVAMAALLFIAALALAGASGAALAAALAVDRSVPWEALAAGEIGPMVDAVRAAASSAPASLALVTATPLLLGLVAALLATRSRPAPSEPSTPETAATEPPGPPPEDAALRMLALLQQEARFIDFVQEDIGAYEDAQVGAAVREIHADCRKALAERLDIERIFAEDEGTTVKVDAGFDSNAVRLTGKVTGEPPFSGVLQHCGWRVVGVNLPQPSGTVDARVLAPAEVEVA